MRHTPPPARTPSDHSPARTRRTWLSLFLLLLLALPSLKLTFQALFELLALAEADQKFEAIAQALDERRDDVPPAPHPEGSEA